MSSNKAAHRHFKKHPLQRLPAPSRGLPALLHAASLLSFYSNFQYLRVTPNPVNDSYGWHFQYLTVLGLGISTACFVFGLLADLTLSRRLFLIKNALSICCTPLQVLISLLYWTLRTIDPKLVVPEWAPPPSLHVDFGFHVIPAIALVIDLLLFSPPYTLAALPAIILAVVLVFGYWFWIELCYSRNAFYPYPIFGMLSMPYRMLLFANSALIFFVALWGLKWLYRAVNGKEIVTVATQNGPRDVKKAQ